MNETLSLLFGSLLCKELKNRVVETKREPWKDCLVPVLTPCLWLPVPALLPGWFLSPFFLLCCVPSFSPSFLPPSLPLSCLLSFFLSLSTLGAHSHVFPFDSLILQKKFDQRNLDFYRTQGSRLLSKTIISTHLKLFIFSLQIITPLLQYYGLKNMPYEH